MRAAIAEHLGQQIGGPVDHARLAVKPRCRSDKPDDSMRWLATVIQMDGRRIDLLELIKMGGHADPGSGRGR
ncbi:Conserved membrane protein of uncharacterised function [Mycobacterium tuberculosis]|nr:Conserved membrane protein of uncharacterised function [Mycobacterium tuberculosis]